MPPKVDPNEVRFSTQYNFHFIFNSLFQGSLDLQEHQTKYLSLLCPFLKESSYFIGIYKTKFQDILGILKLKAKRFSILLLR